MLFKSLIAALAVIFHIQSVAGHPHQLHPFHANKDIAPSTTAFQHQRRSQHAPVNRLGAHPLDKTPVPVVQDKVQETITSHVPRLEPESIQIPSEPPVDPQNNYAFDVIQHGFLPSGVPRGWLEAQQQAKTNRARKLKARTALMARMQALTATIAEAFQDEPSDLVASKRSPIRFQDFSAKQPTSESKAPRKREPTPFVGNHVVDLEAVKQIVSSNTKRSVPGEGGLALPVKSLFTDSVWDQAHGEPAKPAVF